jgi:hypothetical protein
MGGYHPEKAEGCHVYDAITVYGTYKHDGARYDQVSDDAIIGFFVAVFGIDLHGRPP